MSTKINGLQTRFEQLEHTNACLNTAFAELKARNAEMEGQFRAVQRRLRIQASLAFCGLLGAILISPANRTALAQGYGVTLATLNTRLTAVENKTQYMATDTTAKSVTFSGCNLFVNNGSGHTYTFAQNAAGEGLGNLIIGYNLNGYIDPTPHRVKDIRTGSHNLILGDQNNYASYGGIVAGRNNAISAPYASITGGNANIADGFFAAVSGGASNTASGDNSSISGGRFNSAQGDYASVSGGASNTASGPDASVSGGAVNTASYPYASVIGGRFNSAQGDYASVSGGSSNTASAPDASVSGGYDNTANGQSASVSGGISREC